MLLAWVITVKKNYTKENSSGSRLKQKDHVQKAEAEACEVPLFIYYGTSDGGMCLCAVGIIRH